VPRPWRGALYRVPLASVTALHFSAVATGMARRAIDTLAQLANVKTPHRSPGLLNSRVQVQEALARAEVALESARAYRDQVVDEAWRVLEGGGSLSLEQRARVRLAGTNAAESAARAVDLMYAAGGTTSIEEDFPLSRFFRDVHVIAQHVTVLPLYYELIGRVFLGLELPDSRPF
jgi:alkylation response protein AidB-like acyl-CoA dehydrogenase